MSIRPSGAGCTTGATGGNKGGPFSEGGRLGKSKLATPSLHWDLEPAQAQVAGLEGKVARPHLPTHPRNDIAAVKPSLVAIRAAYHRHWHDHAPREMDADATIRPRPKKNGVVGKLRDLFRRCASQPVLRVIKLINGGAFQPVLHVCQRLRREEGSAGYDAGAEAEGLRLETVE